jgi:hypothetical protein
MLCAKLIYLILEDVIFVDIQKVTETCISKSFNLDRCFTEFITPSSEILSQSIIIRISILGFLAVSSEMPIYVT